MRKSVTAAVLAACAVVAGCSTTVAGTPVADPSAVPKPETGSYATTARTIGAPSQADGVSLEGYRMVAAMPYLYDIDPALHFQGDVSVGSGKTGAASVKNIFGEAADKAIGGVVEVAAVVGAGSQQQGAKYDPKVEKREVTIAVLRTASDGVAASAVGSSLMAAQKDIFGKDEPAKVALSIPGYDKAIAYTQAYEGAGRSTVAFLTYKQYVIGVYGDFSADQIRTYFDKQTKELDGFTPTPLDKVTSLKLDESGVATLTLAPSKGSGGYSLPTRQAVPRQTDVSRSVKTFADAGVDVIGSGGSTVYRARDAEGAKHVADEFIAETKGAYAGAESERVTGVPGSTCLTYATYEGSKDKRTYCVVPVGRYLAEVTTTQHDQATQAIGAAYLILAAQK
ncbi:DUF7373 family lipoprotein [Tsukamurella spumae]|uniref:DUF7373 family lipoprotein n=1 Tax=Tsukamurella spumae TaxID=44753 RepID=UPI0031DF5E53